MVFRTLFFICLLISSSFACRRYVHRYDEGEEIQKLMEQYDVYGEFYFFNLHDTKAYPSKEYQETVITDCLDRVLDGITWRDPKRIHKVDSATFGGEIRSRKRTLRSNWGHYTFYTSMSLDKSFPVVGNSDIGIVGIRLDKWGAYIPHRPKKFLKELQKTFPNAEYLGTREVKAQNDLDLRNNRYGTYSLKSFWKWFEKNLDLLNCDDRQLPQVEKILNFELKRIAPALTCSITLEESGSRVLVLTEEDRYGYSSLHIEKPEIEGWDFQLTLIDGSRAY